MSRLVAYVHVPDPDGTMRAFGPDDEDLPDWAVEQMGDHCFVDGKRPAKTRRSSAKPEPKSD